MKRVMLRSLLLNNVAQAIIRMNYNLFIIVVIKTVIKSSLFAL